MPTKPSPAEVASVLGGESSDLGTQAAATSSMEKMQDLLSKMAINQAQIQATAATNAAVSTTQASMVSQAAAKPTGPGIGGGILEGLGIGGGLGLSQLASKAVAIADIAQSPGTARAGEFLSVWRDAEAEQLQNQDTAGQIKNGIRDTGQFGQKWGWRAFIQGVEGSKEGMEGGWGPVFHGGPNNHGSKPAQGN